MRKAGIRSVRKGRYRATTNSNHRRPIAENLLARNFTVSAPNRVWVTDITAIWTNEGYLYLAAILDLFSRRVVGFAMSERIHGDLAPSALRMAIGRRLPKPGLVHHSDRGVQYATLPYQRLLEQQKMICSMSRKGNCWDNAVAESFFATLKAELLTRFETRVEARRAIFHFIESFYNFRRRHSTLGYVSPVTFEKRFAEKKRKAA